MFNLNYFRCLYRFLLSGIRFDLVRVKMGVLSAVL